MRSCTHQKRHGPRCTLLFLLCVLFLTRAESQSTTIGGLETATQDRLEDPGWWPTKGSYPRNSFVGNATCQQCHAGLFRLQRTTPMANAASPASDSLPLHRQTTSAFENGPYSYRLLSSASGAMLSVTNGTETESTPLPWAFGSGELGQTYVYQRDGRWFESRVSLYTRLGQLDITTGHGHLPPEKLDDALGRGMKDADAQRCFACHTGVSTTAGHFEPQSTIPGVTCESCHGPGADHVKAMASGAAAHRNSNILNPATMSPVDSVDFCGACHRTWADIAFSGAAQRGIEVVRFQPYRLEKSRCWGKAGDPRLTCVACHDPHTPLQRDAASYDIHCLSCHLRHDEVASPAKPGASCPRGSDHCITCHMPKVTVPEMHGEFTDHLIRVVNADGILPK